MSKGAPTLSTRARTVRPGRRSRTVARSRAAHGLARRRGAFARHIISSTRTIRGRIRRTLPPGRRSCSPRPAADPLAHRQGPDARPAGTRRPTPRAAARGRPYLRRPPGRRRRQVPRRPPDARPSVQDGLVSLHAYLHEGVHPDHPPRRPGRRGQHRLGRSACPRRARPGRGQAGHTARARSGVDRPARRSAELPLGSPLRLDYVADGLVGARKRCLLPLYDPAAADNGSDAVMDLIDAAVGKQGVRACPGHRYAQPE